IVFNVVVLPEPEAPTIATNSPRRTASVTPLTANVAPPSNDFDTPSSATTMGSSLTPPPGPRLPRARRVRGPEAGRAGNPRPVPTIRVAWNVLSARARRILAYAPFRGL